MGLFSSGFTLFINANVGFDGDKLFKVFDRYGISPNITVK